MNIDAQILDVLSNAVINENALKLTGQLDRKLYEATNKVLLAAGGKWNRRLTYSRETPQKSWTR